LRMGVEGKVVVGEAAQGQHSQFVRPIAQRAQDGQIVP
jgi:hypothetical protein